MRWFWLRRRLWRTIGLRDEDSRRDATNTACGETPQPRSEEAIALVLKQAEALADDWREN